MKAIKRVRLINMPRDKWDYSRMMFVHATGYLVLTDSNEWHIEYEDNEYEDAKGCLYAEESEGEYYEQG